MISLLIICISLFVGCTNVEEEKQDIYITLPDLTGMSKEEITEELNEHGITHYFQFAFLICYDESYYDKFVEYLIKYHVFLSQVLLTHHQQKCRM